MNNRTIAVFFVLFCSVFTHATEKGWTDDFEAAKAQAQREGKDLLLDFTGSDWCGWCIRLRDEVFRKDEFIREAPKHFILVELDFPRSTKLSEKIQEQNQALAAEMMVNGYPSIVLTDAKGLAYAKTGYKGGGPVPYLTHLEELRGHKALRDDLLKTADSQSGTERAKTLEKALNRLEQDAVQGQYEELVTKIIDADKDNGAGLKKKYEAKREYGRISQIAENGDVDGALKALSDYFTQNQVEGEAKQEGLFLKSILLFNKSDKPGAIETLEAARAAAPQSERAAQIPQIIQRLKSDM